MLPNTIGEPYDNFYPVQTHTNIPFADVIFPQLPLSSHYFVELEILSQDINQNEWREYEEAMEEYDREMVEFYKEKKKLMDMAIDITDDEPERPRQPKSEKPEYKKINFNFSDIVIASWASQWDEEKEHEIIIVEYYIKAHVINAINQYNVKMSRKDWVELITKLGAIN